MTPKRSGDNVLGVVKSLCNSSDLSSPAQKEAEERVVYFDLLGLLPLQYPHWVGRIANMVAIAVAVMVIVVDAASEWN